MALAGLLLSAILPGMLYAEVSTDLMSDFTNIPINLTGNDVAPLVLMNVSRDHQLSYKAYNDYSDLDGDGTPETTYDDTIEYYGYFDSAKCYTYSTTNNHFSPAAMATGTNSHYCSGQWSGNFMNWASMTRMDIVRKILYGGMRSTDTNSLTVLERQYLPTDAHAFAKYYNGSDIAQLTPFTGINTTPPEAGSTTSHTFPTHTSGTENRTFTTSLSASYGDQILVFRDGNEATHWMIGGVSGTGSGTITIQIPAGSYQGTGTYSNWTLRNLSATGITLTNMTRGTSSGTNRYSDTNTNPPLIRVAQGNFALWTANERWQGYWIAEKSNTQSGFTAAGGFRSNGNKAYLSGIYASAENPSQTTHGLGTGIRQGEYVARVEVANAALLGQEKVKNYSGTYKPIGLLQVYGENDQIFFGLLTGTYARNISGGVLRKNAASFSDEVNAADGTFNGGTVGIVHNLNMLRLYGYDYNDGTYIGRDSCTYQQTGFVLSGGANTQGTPANQGNCSTWGNPMSEIYLESLRYLAGQSPTPEFTYGTGSKDAALGLTVATWADPLDTTNYCAPLNVLNFNASVSGYDGHYMAGAADIGCTETAAELTDAVGIYEGLDLSSWFVGNTSDESNDLCSAKAIGSGFGSFYGICPEAPTQQGTYMMAGLAHYSNTNRIRTDLVVPPARANSRDLMVSTYGIALATNVPKIEVQVGSGMVTILPAYRLTVSGRFGGGTLVDFKIITQTPTYGKFYVNWEDSEMGGDYDQDMWGTIEYTVSGDEITITTNAVSASTANGQGFGYIISGTNLLDGAHFHSGIYNFNYTDPTGVLGCNNCVAGDPPTSVTYQATGTSAGILEDPLWYAAKWGGFIDNNNDQLPQPEEWDSRDNRDGSPTPDGIPDNYFFATNPLQLENSLNRVFLTILQRASSGTAAAVVSNNVSGVGALYQAYYEPLRRDGNDNEVSWIGTVQALWLDSYSFLREDDGNAVLDDYITDPVIQQFYDEVENKTKIRRYISTEADTFTPFYMQGTVTAYNSATGSLSFTIEESSDTNAGIGPFASWTVYNLTQDRTGNSTTELPIHTAGTATVTVEPNTALVNVGEEVMIAHFASTVIALEDINTLWNARQKLSFNTAQAADQRTFSFEADDSATGGRHIKTWLDTNHNGVVDAGEIVDFVDATFDTSNFGYLNTASLAEAQNIVNYVRGEEITGYRNRTIDYDGTGEKVIRLADVVNATPTVVGAPSEALDLIYKDNSYGLFRKQYSHRRQVLYVGSNGGMLHAFNGGFYNSAARSFQVSGTKHNGDAAVEHPLGSEIWSYVPMNLLPHLKWLTDVDYTHVYYVDGKPKVFDAKIFDDADPDHPGGWGTVLVVGMRFGGGSMTVDTAADGLTGGDDDRLFSSAYVILDITNPEAEPQVLAEIQIPDGSFSTSYPAAFKVKSNDPVVTNNNQWFLTFGSGPTNMSGESNQNATLYVFDLAEIANPGTSTATPSGCTQETVGSGGSMTILACDTGIANSFIGDPISVDWNLDYRDDNVYFGVIGDTEATSGRAMRFSMNGDHDAGNWVGPTTLIDTAQPVVAAVAPGLDGTDQKWIFFGTGRLFDSPDQLTTATQSIYGIKEDGVTTVLKADLFNVTDVEVETDGDLIGAGATINTFRDLENDIVANYDGWYLDLPLIQGTAGTDPATRVINASALAGGVLFTTAYQPGLDLCTGEGSSRLYGLYYRTGTAYPSPSVLGTYTSTITGDEYSSKFIELGHGFATTPSIHTGARNAGNEVSVFTQLSTGAVIRTEAETVFSVRSGMQAWNEPK
jgi:Tfp pilus tip-associated adhesin PilY1